MEETKVLYLVTIHESYFDKEDGIDVRMTRFKIFEKQENAQSYVEYLLTQNEHAEVHEVATYDADWWSLAKA